MIHPDTRLQFIDAEMGYGVFATKKIPKGTITWVHDKFDKTFTPEEMELLEPPYRALLQKYCYRDHHGHLILCWDFGRYVNHSFNANCMSTAYDLEIAIRDIEEGEELTDDYGYLNVSAPFTPKDENTIRKTVYPDDVLRHFRQWDDMVLEVLPLFNNVAQPLEIFLKKDVITEIQEIISGKKEMKSILETYFDPVHSGV